MTTPSDRYDESSKKKRIEWATKLADQMDFAKNDILRESIPSLGIVPWDTAADFPKESWIAMYEALINAKIKRSWGDHCYLIDKALAKADEFLND